MSAYLKQRNMTGVQLYQEFEYRMFDILKGLGKDTVTWDSTFETGMTMPKNAVVHDYQGGNASVAKIAKAGVKVSLCLSLSLSLSLSVSTRYAVQVIVSSLAGMYVAGQAPWTQIFTEEIMPRCALLALLPCHSFSHTNLKSPCAEQWADCR